jgi:hypothetical protein
MGMVKIKNQRLTAIFISVFFVMSFLFVASDSTFAQTKKKKRVAKVTKKKPMIESFDKCLPKEINLDDIIYWDLNTKKTTSVKDELTRLKAKCVSGKLVDEQNKEIRFFKPECWGNPPADYLEIRQREREELEELKKKYTVIIFNCNPMIP